MGRRSYVKLSSKGQIVIPAEIRRELGLTAGDRIIVERVGDAILLRPVVRLSKLMGVDRIEGASEEVERMRAEWDREFEGRA
ncbi:AbrB/MazE/SpoVT family DNA-binding domain-containing protein [Infirmifilum lucidum]|uniref:AbrB/MazE/SpoVT family DNA-binding domain-containing protein n=1 Tax=Infirmifilum lucidum TaxID=2776706 RepID=A0A7L9FGS5_9CREN|nr:AbrB/MazE/SpoVT family DNA-binding domain-containing protein [Infirmifilum lucidum]QOJ78831.1 AbrB/MazE/SpoVT family DNA-binding domain-containing protein [Infirmifilum lucidum]